MSFADWMILAAALLPYLAVASARGPTSGYDNTAPRRWTAGLQGWRQRLHWAHQNHLEAFPPFAAGVLLAEMRHAPQATINGLAGAFLLLRLVYTGLYLTGPAALRTLIWFLGLLSVIGLFLAAA
ncbi:MAG TPA: MAPEG family protein [Acetobacteraceae bacterium]|nr:MAPEG family protein [Acetobacteraceae bacterium]